MTRRSPDMNGPAQESPPETSRPSGGPRPHQATAGGAGPPNRTHGTNGPFRLESLPYLDHLCCVGGPRRSTSDIVRLNERGTG